MNRSDIDSKYKWQLEHIYANDELWEQDFCRLEAGIPRLVDIKQTITRDAQSMLAGFELIDEYSLLLEKLFVYARMRRDEDNSSPKYQALVDRATGLSVKISAAISFLSPLLLSLDEGTLQQYMGDPLLKNYAFHISDLLRSKAHVLTEKEENLLSLSGDFSGGARDVFTMLNNADLTFEDVDGQPLTHASYISIMHTADRPTRKKAYENYYASFNSHINTIGAAYANSVKKDIFYARARKYEGALQKALFSDNVPVSLYENLISTVHENLDGMHDYIQLRKQVLGYPELYMYDIYSPLVSQTSASYTYEQAIELNLAGLTPLGQDYIDLLKEAFAGGWVDVFETPGKTSGAYSWGVYGTHPYVLLNHREDLDSVFTIAHEMGHAMHTYFSDKTQPYNLAQYTIFVAEVASTVNEILLTKHLLATTQDQNLKKYILNHYIDQFRTTVFRQTMFAEFEKLSHEMAQNSAPLTPAALSEVYSKLNAQYHGSGIVTDENIALEWARIPHFYNAFYVYKYATGFSCAVQIANNIQQPGMAEKYRKFLSSGGTNYPIDLLMLADVDIASGQPVLECMKEFKRAVEEFKGIINK